MSFQRAEGFSPHTRAVPGLAFPPYDHIARVPQEHLCSLLSLPHPYSSTSVLDTNIQKSWERVMNDTPTVAPQSPACPTAHTSHICSPAQQRISAPIKRHLLLCEVHTHTHMHAHTQNTPHITYYICTCARYTCIKAPDFMQGSCTWTCTGPPRAHSPIRDEPPINATISLLPIALHTPHCSFPGGPLPLDRGRVFLAGRRVPGQSGSGGLGMGGSSPAQRGSLSVPARMAGPPWGGCVTSLLTLLPEGLPQGASLHQASGP